MKLFGHRVTVWGKGKDRDLKGRWYSPWLLTAASHLTTFQGDRERIPGTRGNGGYGSNILA